MASNLFVRDNEKVILLKQDREIAMAKDERKQHVPIFVGSTFIDLKSYRAAVGDSLHRLETIVRGMEYFGSKPGKPLDECLEIVRTCKVYIGIFGMRYGSIPEGRKKSMTHLEYDEAQKCELPSLIYIIDENNQPVLPKFVETGPNAVKLSRLKEDLRKKHMISEFTTEEDLASKILLDLPPVLEKLGTKVEGSLESDNHEESKQILRKFEKLPKLWRGKQVVFEFVKNRDFDAAEPGTVEALELEHGSTVSSYVQTDENTYFHIYGEDRIAEKLLEVPDGCSVNASGVTVFGLERSFDWGDSGSIEETHVRKGILIKQIIETKPIAHT